MDKQYNFSNLEASFRSFLVAENKNVVSIKNYLSDLRHFFGWFSLYLKSKQIDSVLPNNIQFLTVQMIEEYKSYLIVNKIPNQTINRRFSTIRKFCSFCISQGWLKTNPAKQIKNIDLKSQAKNAKNIEKKSIISDFFEEINKKYSNLDERNLIIDDVAEFHNIINSIIV